MKLRLNIILTVSMGIISACSDGDLDGDERTVTAIGEAGGTAQSAAGQMSLQFEAGTFSGTQEIVIDTLRNTDVPRAVSPVYALGPDRMNLSGAVRMTVDIDPSLLNDSVSVVIARINGNLHEVMEASVWNEQDGQVSVDLTQFGNYAAVTMDSPCETQGELAIRTVSEYNPRAPMAGVEVQVNDTGWVTTNARGYACFPAVNGSYTVRIYQSNRGPVSGTRFDDVWVLVERSENPLVVEVDDITDPRDVEITGQITGLSGQGVPRFAASFGEVIEESITGNNLGLRYNWQGRTPHSTTLHVLESDGADLPSQFFGYGSTEVFVDAPRITEPGSPGTLSGVSIAMAPVNASSVSGSVNVPTVFNGLEQSASLSVGIGDTDLYVGFDANPDFSAPFGYTLPEIPGGQARVFFNTFSQGTPVAGGLFRNLPSAWTLVEVDLPTSNLNVDIPEPASLVSPVANATVAATVDFSWTPSPTAGRHALSAHCVGTDANGEFAINYRSIESVGTQASLPQIPGLDLPSGTICEWSVDMSTADGRSNSGSQGVTIQ